MGFSCGIVGLPNVGKSTLFNALTAAAADAANYPFTTIEPNVGRVAVPDDRLGRIAALAHSAAVVPAHLAFIDIAGLVRGASRGEGLGNRFLAEIRAVDAIAHLVRCFADDEVAHVAGKVDPLTDIEIVETELMLADLDGLERRRDGLIRKAKGGDKDAKALLAVVEEAHGALNEGRPARELRLGEADRARLAQLDLLTAKPEMYVCNVDEAAAAEGNPWSRAVAAHAAERGAGWVMVSAAIEAEIAQLPSAVERKEFLRSLGLDQSALSRMVRAGYELLDLITFFTANRTEAHAWTLTAGATAARAAAAVHSDFARGFICAETVAFDDYVAAGGEQGAREAGRMRQEGRDYPVRDGDVILFRFNL